MKNDTIHVGIRMASGVAVERDGRLDAHGTTTNSAHHRLNREFGQTKTAPSSSVRLSPHSGFQHILGRGGSILGHISVLYVIHACEK